LRRLLTIVPVLFACGLTLAQTYHGVALAPNGVDAWVIDIDTVAVYHTPDFGMTWEPQTIATTRRLFGVFFLDAERGWTCGDVGAIHATIDGGLNWFRQNLGGPKYASRIQFLDSVHGWSSGGTAMLLFTRDGGATWTSDFFPPQFPTDTVDFQGLSFVDTVNGWLVAGRYPELDTLGNPIFTGGQGYIAKVEASGDTFRHTLQLKDAVNDFFDVEFTDATTGWVVGGEDSTYIAAVLHTTNGGTDWVQQPLPSSARYLRAVDFVSPNQGWACGRSGTIVHTSNGGTTWESQDYYIDTTLFDIQFCDSLRGMIAGNSVVLLTTDGGQHWVRGFGGVEEATRQPHAGIGVQSPSRGHVRFTIGGARRTGVIAIYDAAGCQVRTLRNRTGHSESVEWDGLDDSGRPVRSGLYLAQVENGAQSATARFVLLKE